MTKTAYKRVELKKQIKKATQNPPSLKNVDLGHVESSHNSFMDYPMGFMWPILLRSAMSRRRRPK